MEYSKSLKYHYQTKKGWINDPNGLVYYKGYYHVFYQHAPDYEIPWQEDMHWGHARTKDFLHWEELPVALFPDMPYDKDGCFSGTAIVKDDVLYLFYASICKNPPQGQSKQSVSVAYSTDGLHFEKYQGNPVIPHYPIDGCKDFRDPAVCYANGKYYCVMATGNQELKKARLALYESEDLFKWEYRGIMCDWDNARFTECPSLVPYGDKFLLSVSVCTFENHYFSVMYGAFEDGVFHIESSSEIDKGPDQYAGQIFCDHLGRAILISWMPGWKYKGFADADVGCMSVARQIFVEDGKMFTYPIEELRHLLKDSDPALVRTEDGFVVERTRRDPFVYRGKVEDLKLIRDGYVLEIFVNGGTEVYSVLL